jgi:hypothetical protein
MSEACYAVVDDIDIVVRSGAGGKPGTRRHPIVDCWQEEISSCRVWRWKTAFDQFRKFLTELFKVKMQPPCRLCRRDIQRVDPMSDR